jgi:hypothetical protein
MRFEAIKPDRLSHHALLEDVGLLPLGENQEGAIIEGAQRRHMPVAPHVHVGSSPDLFLNVFLGSKGTS